MIKYILLMAICGHSWLSSVEFVLFTEPKTGTHLLIPILSELTGKRVYWAKEYMMDATPIDESFEEASKNPNYLFFSILPTPWKRKTMDKVWATNKKNGAFLHLHAPYTPVMENYLAERKCVNFFIKRDPRDQIVSLLNHYKYIQLNDKALEVLPSDEEKLLYMIQKKSRAYAAHFMGWLHSPVCCVLDFNKLMGEHGGSATDADAMQEMRKIANALQLDLPDSYLLEVYKRNFGKGWSFFKGKTATWKEYFNADHIAVIKNEIGDLLIELGYEKDLNW